MKKAWIWFPDAPYTQESALRAAKKTLPKSDWSISEGPADESKGPFQLYFADYDWLPFENLHPAVYQKDVASTSTTPFPQLSCYSIRKSLIRKNYLANTLHLARIKRGSSSQNQGIQRVDLKSKERDDDDSIAPKTWVFEITSVDDLDELLTDELYDMREELERNESRSAKEKKWYILKPAMADRGMGIRLLDSIETLQDIFIEFEENEEESEEEDGDEKIGTSIVTSQLRHFIIQEYLNRPLLIQPPGFKGAHKFHIRAYVLAQGSLKVFLYDEMLALFAPVPYQQPSGKVDLNCHLTNTCLQIGGQLETVHLLQDLVGSKLYPTHNDELLVNQDLIDSIHVQACSVIAETFQASVNADQVNFQPWPYAWEIFGVDLMVEIKEDDVVNKKKPSQNIKVWLLEVNAQPDFARTGNNLQVVIDRLFERTLEITVLGRDSGKGEQDWSVGTSRDGMTLCLDMPLGAEGW